MRCPTKTGHSPPESIHTSLLDHFLAGTRNISGESHLDAWRWASVEKKYGGMGTEQLKELKRLQKENERLRRAVSDLTLDKLILSEAARGNF